MKPDDFENHLARQSVRILPPEWREEILRAAQAATPSVRGCSPVPARVAPWWHEWLWPAPSAWAGLAAAWIAVVALNQLAAPPSASVQFARTGGRTPSVLALWFDQGAWMAQITTSPAERTERPRRGTNAPRSEVRPMVREA